MTSSSWVLFLCEPQVFLYDGKVIINDLEHIRSRLRRGYRRLRVIIYDAQIELSEVVVPEPKGWKGWGLQRWWAQRCLGPLIHHQCGAKFGVMDGVGWQHVDRPSLYGGVVKQAITHSIVKLSLTLWLQEWFDFLANAPLQIKKILPLEMVIAQWLVATTQLRAVQGLGLTYVPLSQAQLAVMSVTWEGEFLLARSWHHQHHPILTPEVFVETAQYFDKYPLTRGKKFQGFALKEPDDCGGVSVPTITLLQTHNPDAGGVLTQVMSFVATAPGAQLRSAVWSEMLRRGARLKNLLWLLQGLTLCMALLTLPYGVSLLVQTYALRQKIDTLTLRSQKAQQGMAKGAHLSAEKVAFMRYAKSLETEHKQLIAAQNVIAPLALVPKLSQALSSTWRAYRFQWVRDVTLHSQPSSTQGSNQGSKTLITAPYTLKLWVRYTSPDTQDIVTIESDFMYLKNNLQKFFPLGQVGVEESPFDGAGQGPASLGSLKALKSGDVMTARLVLRER